MIDNPYWDEVHEYVEKSDFPWEGPQIERFDFRKRGEDGEPVRYEPKLYREEFVQKYAWSVTDPRSVEFVVEHAGDGMVDPMAGTGYWAYVLAQLGVDVVCYDINPGDNQWHQKNALWVRVRKMRGERAVKRHADRTLFLAWPPYSEAAGARILGNYGGQRVIYIGESEGGCTGDDDMHELLEKDWAEVDCHTPVQWWGLHDRITVYERAPRELEAAADQVEVREMCAGGERAVELPEDNGADPILVPAMQGGGQV